MNINKRWLTGRVKEKKYYLLCIAQGRDRHASEDKRVSKYLTLMMIQFDFHQSYNQAFVFFVFFLFQSRFFERLELT